MLTITKEDVSIITVHLTDMGDYFVGIHLYGSGGMYYYMKPGFVTETLRMLGFDPNEPSRVFYGIASLSLHYRRW